MKVSDLQNEVIIHEIVKRVTREVLEKFPRLANEPFSEYNAHIREEVEFSANAYIAAECDKKFGKRKKQWKIY